MKQTNPGNKFFTEDLYPDIDETGNAFWGYHVANNFSRLLSLSGTAYFHAGLLPDAGQDLFVDVPIDKYQFEHAPIVQFWSTEDNYIVSTVYARATTTIDPIVSSGGRTVYAYPSFGQRLDVVQMVQTYYEDVPGEPVVDSDYLKIGNTSTELMPIVSFSQTRSGLTPPYTWTRWYRAYRGGLETTPEAYAIDSPIYIVGPNGTTGDGLSWPPPESNNKSWGKELSISGSSVRYQPAWVEGYFDSAKLRIRWLRVAPSFIGGGIARAGTVFFRIFGI